MMHIKCLAPCLLCKKQLRSAAFLLFPLSRCQNTMLKPELGLEGLLADLGRRHLCRSEWE